MLPDDLETARVAVADAARRLAVEGLLIGTAGNVSARVPGSDLLAVTATGAVLAACGPEQVSVVDATGAVVAGDLAPTSELELHRVAHATGEVGAVVHTHAPYATAVACVLDELPILHYQQLLLGGTVRVAPYATFGTAELARGVGDALTGRKAALMSNHGAVTVGPTLDQAVEAALLLEWCCRLHVNASRIGTPRVLDETQQAAVVEAAIARSYGTTQPAEETP